MTLFSLPHFNLRVKIRVFFTEPVAEFLRFFEKRSRKIETKTQSFMAVHYYLHDLNGSLSYMRSVD